MHIGTSGYFGMADAGTDTRPKYEPRKTTPEEDAQNTMLMLKTLE